MIAEFGFRSGSAQVSDKVAIRWAENNPLLSRELAVLDLKIKWRPILKTPTQNVLVTLQTNDPLVPRLQLAWSLVPPAPAK